MSQLNIENSKKINLNEIQDHYFTTENNNSSQNNQIEPTVKCSCLENSSIEELLKLVLLKAEKSQNYNIINTIKNLIKNSDNDNDNNNNNNNNWRNNKQPKITSFRSSNSTSNCPEFANLTSESLDIQKKRENYNRIYNKHMKTKETQIHIYRPERNYRENRNKNNVNNKSSNNNLNVQACQNNKNY